MGASGRISLMLVAALFATPAAAMAEPQTPEPAPPPPIVYSHGYQVRAKVHKTSSLAFLPLVVTQAALGRSLFESPTPTKQAWHRGVAWGLGGLFATNTVTGVWNLVESRKDPHGRKRRFAHGLLMLASDAGFLSTALTAPSLSKPGYIDQRSRHRAIAVTSIATAATGYALMLFRR